MNESCSTELLTPEKSEKSEIFSVFISLSELLYGI
jgi:hypothetical protein